MCRGKMCLDYRTLVCTLEKFRLLNVTSNMSSCVKSCNTCKEVMKKCRLSSSYFFLFFIFLDIPIFFLFFREIPIFSYFFRL